METTTIDTPTFKTYSNDRTTLTTTTEEAVCGPMGPQVVTVIRSYDLHDYPYDELSKASLDYVKAHYFLGEGGWASIEDGALRDEHIDTVATFFDACLGSAPEVRYDPAIKGCRPLPTEYNRPVEMPDEAWAYEPTGSVIRDVWDGEVERLQEAYDTDPVGYPALLNEVLTSMYRDLEWDYSDTVSRNHDDSAFTRYLRDVAGKFTVNGYHVDRLTTDDHVGRLVSETRVYSR